MDVDTVITLNRSLSDLDVSLVQLLLLDLKEHVTNRDGLLKVLTPL